MGPRKSCTMIGHVQGGTHVRSLRHSQRVLERMAPLVRYGLFAFGVSVFLNRVEPLVSDAQFTWGERRLMAIVALITLGGFGLAGWVAGRLFRASADVIEVFIEGAEANGRAAYLIEVEVVPTLRRIADVLERSSASASRAPGDDAKARAFAVAQQAIDEGRWGQAERLIESFGRQFSGAAEAGTLSEALAAARGGAIQDLQSKLDAALRGDDPGRVIDCRDALTEHMRGKPLEDLDRWVVQWLVGRVQARRREGTPEGALAAARLAARVVESFGDTPEGISLRAALPSLRRGAGLCPRCARPGPVTCDACPRCAGDRSRTTPMPDRPNTEVKS